MQKWPGQYSLLLPVSAQKREENAQNVPIAVTVVSGDTFNKANTSGFADVAKFAPSLTMTTGDQPANSSIVIRGIGTFAFSIAAEPSVLVVVDDVTVGYQAQAFTDLVDIDRVEVLNGPQSTLFGKSASAGVVNVTTKAPTREFSFFGDVKVTDDDEQRYTMSLSGPISDTLSFRGGLLQGGRFDVKIFTQEFRLSSNGHHDFNYLLGAFYSAQDLSRGFRRGFDANKAAISNYLGQTRYYNYALFGQTDWTFLPRTTLITGLRVNREESRQMRGRALQIH